MIKVAIVTCNYNKREQSLQCIKAILDSKYNDFHIFFVDNASTDGSAAAVNAEYGDCRRLTIIRNQENLGSSGGFNKGLRTAFVKNDFKYFMCVDNDAVVDENCIENLVNFLDENTGVGIAGAKILQEKEPGLIQNYGSVMDYEKFELKSPYLNRADDETLPKYVCADAVPASALMIRRTVMEIIGFLPEDYFLYWDDTEWCARTRRAGFKVVSVGNAKATHPRKVGKEDGSTLPVYYSWRNKIRFFSEHIDKARAGDFAEQLTESIFRFVYEGYYRNEPKLSETVIAAVDDALHGRKGCAGANRIFDIEKTYDGLIDVVSGMGIMPKVNIVDNGYADFAGELKERLLDKKEDIVFSDINPDVTFVITEDIFSVRDMSFEKIYVDLRGNVMGKERDGVRVANYRHAKRAFGIAWRPLIERLVTETERK